MKQIRVPHRRLAAACVAVLGGVALVAVAGAPASAATGATVSISGARLVVDDAAGGDDVLDVSVDDTWVYVAAPTTVPPPDDDPDPDLPVPIGPVPVAGAGCEDAPAAATVRCPRAGLTSARFDLGDGADVLTVQRSFALPGTVDGGPGDDRLSSGRGADRVIGGTGSDTVSYRPRVAPVTVRLGGVGAVSGEAGEGDTVDADVENVTGSQYGDLLVGSSGPNVISGSGGADQIDGGLGADTISGGTGNDTLTYASRTRPVTVTVGESVGASGEPGENDRILSEVDTIVGTSFNDTIVGDERDQTLVGGPGDDVLRGGDGDDQLVGGPGRDRLIGGTGLDEASYRERTAPVRVVLGTASGNGEAGEDDDLSSGIDYVSGGSADDVLIGRSTNDVLVGGPGNDYLEGRGGADSLSGGSGVDLVSYSDRAQPVNVTIDGVRNDGSGGEGDFVMGDVENVLGGASDDVLVGSDDPNTLIGGPGNDVLVGGPGADTLVGSEGIDAVSYAERVGAVRASLDGRRNDGARGELDDIATDVERLVGGAGSDRLSGSRLANVLVGGAGNDTLIGKAGRDKLVGGSGRDRALGGTGRDRCSAERKKSC